MTSLIGLSLVTSSVELHGGGHTDFQDLTIPTGGTVVGFGFIPTQVAEDEVTWVDIDTYSPGDQGLNMGIDTVAHSGPHPSDDTKWRFVTASPSGSWYVRGTIWMTVIGCGE